MSGVDGEIPDEPPVLQAHGVLEDAADPVFDARADHRYLVAALKQSPADGAEGEDVLGLNRGAGGDGTGYFGDDRLIVRDAEGAGPGLNLQDGPDGYMNAGGDTHVELLTGRQSREVGDHKIGAKPGNPEGAELVAALGGVDYPYEEVHRRHCFYTARLIDCTDLFGFTLLIREKSGIYHNFI